MNDPFQGLELFMEDDIDPELICLEVTDSQPKSVSVAFYP